MVELLDDANDATPEAARKGVVTSTHHSSIGLANGAAQGSILLKGN